MTGTPRKWCLCLAMLFMTALSHASGGIFAQVEMRPNHALEYLLKHRSELKQLVRYVIKEKDLVESEFSIGETFRMRDGWFLVRGGSYSMCSDDITFTALFHPEKDALRFLFSTYTGTVEGGLFQINEAGDRIIVGFEAINSSPPERFKIENGIPIRDRAFNQAFRESFDQLGKELDPSFRYWYTRTFSFTPDREFCLTLEISSDDGTKKSLKLLYRESSNQVERTP